MSGADGPRRRAKVGLVIGAGGVKCAAALGARRAIDRAGIDIDIVVGCSGGSIYATTIAIGMSVDDATERTMRLWTHEVMEVKNRRALFQAVSPSLTGFTSEWGLHKSTVMAEKVQAAFGDAVIEDAEIPLFFTATDFYTGDQVVLREGRIVDGILATSAIPFVFPPVRIGDRLLVDGFVSDPLPIGVASQEGADIIIALGFEAPHGGEITSVSRFAHQLSAIMTNNLLKSAYAFHSLAHHSEVVAVVPEFDRPISMFSTDLIPHVIDKGEEAMERELPHILRAIDIAAAGEG